MKIWLDDRRPAPKEYLLALSVNAAKKIILELEEQNESIDIIDCDHDMGDYFKQGGDGICLLDWLVERNTLYPIALHTSNPAGRANMERLIQRFW